MKRGKERAHERSRDIKHFETDNPNEMVAIISTGQHYQKQDGTWDDIDNLMQQDAQGNFTSQAKDIQFELGVDGSYTITKDTVCCYYFKPTGLWLYDSSSKKTEKIQDAASTVVWERDGNLFVCRDIFDNIDLTLQVFEHTMSKVYTVRKRLTHPDLMTLGMNPSTTQLVIAYQNALPFTDAQGAAVSGGVNADLYLKVGHHRLKFPAGMANDSGKNSTEVTALVGGSFPFALSVPYSFFVKSRYPLLIDPTTTLNEAAAGDDATMMVSDNSAPTGTGGLNISETTLQVGQNTFLADSKNNIYESDWYRAVLRFNTSSIYSWRVLSANLILYPSAVCIDTVPHYCNVVKDWGIYGQAAAGVVAVSGTVGIAPSTMAIGAPVTFPIDPSSGYLDSIVGGSAYLCFNVFTQTSLNLSVYYNAVCATTAAVRPQLQITYTPGSGTKNTYTPVAPTPPLTLSSATTYSSMRGFIGQAAPYYEILCLPPPGAVANYYSSELPATCPVVFQNMVVGSQYMVTNLSTGLVIAQGTATGSTLTLSLEFYGNVNLNIRVRKAGYLPYESIGVVTYAGLTVWVAQITDTLYGI